MPESDDSQPEARHLASGIVVAIGGRTIEAALL